MQLISVDPRSLKENPDRSRRSQSSPQPDALLCASIKAIGVVQAPVVRLDPDGGIAGDTIGADQFLVNTATDEFLSCLSRNALETAAGEAGVETGAKVKETRAALVAHFAESRSVHPAALIAPDEREVTAFAAAFAKADAAAAPQDIEITKSSDDRPVEPEVGEPWVADEPAGAEEIESDCREAAE
ncbi:hypothetical protein KX729_28875 [Rhizobium sp. XQZ8]|uniref:hypothetical protein n=1 Tax=Rhizobium populisoli TaxID=2859785 RepID=UPI001CA553E2|nr:hypothetical protein [Rhizobium populisoli]MBW6425438.1 hypothetical protein [Rhizobium populisoli]